MTSFRALFQNAGSADHDIRQKTCSVTVHSDHTIVLSCGIIGNCNHLIKNVIMFIVITKNIKDRKYSTVMTQRCVIAGFLIG